jgi:hypothetical protein
MMPRFIIFPVVFDYRLGRSAGALRAGDHPFRHALEKAVNRSDHEYCAGIRPVCAPQFWLDRVARRTVTTRPVDALRAH